MNQKIKRKEKKMLVTKCCECPTIETSEGTLCRTCGKVEPNNFKELSDSYYDGFLKAFQDNIKVQQTNEDNYLKDTQKVAFIEYSLRLLFDNICYTMPLNFENPYQE